MEDGHVGHDVSTNKPLVLFRAALVFGGFRFVGQTRSRFQRLGVSAELRSNYRTQDSYNQSLTVPHY